VSSFDKRIFYEDFEFDVPKDVYEPAEDTFMFADNLKVDQEDTVIDVGTGCGILGIVAARKAAEVFAVDVNPHALRCARKNAALNRVGNKMVFIRTDLFESIKIDKKFDLVIFNSPYLPLENEDDSWLGYAWSGGTDGRRIIDRFIREAPRHLYPDGRILLMQSSLSSIGETLKSLAERGLNSRVVASQRLPFFETVVLIRAVLSRSK
jgi:release factor glutamine methyltransferase